MNKIYTTLILIVFLLIVNISYAQNSNTVDKIIYKAKQYYEEAQNVQSITESIDLSGRAIDEIMNYLPNAKGMDMIRYADAVTPMLKFDAETCLILLMLSNHSPLDEETTNFLKGRIMQSCDYLFSSLELNDRMEFLFGTLTKEDVYYLRGRAKFFLKIPCLDDLNKAGEAGRDFMRDWNINGTATGYSTYYNPRYGFYITYPSSLYIQGVSENNDGKSFFSYDASIKLIASARLNISNESATDLINMERQTLKNSGCSITYSMVKDNKVVLSGYMPNGNIYYQKLAVCSLWSEVYNKKTNIIATARVEYPQDEREIGNDIIKMIGKFPYK